MESGVIRHSLYQWSRVGLGNSGRPRGVYRRVPIGRVHGLLGNPLQRWIPVFLPIPLAASRSPSLSQTNCCTFSAATHILPKFCQKRGGRAQAFKEIMQKTGIHFCLEGVGENCSKGGPGLQVGCWRHSWISLPSQGTRAKPVGGRLCAAISCIRHNGQQETFWK